MRLINCLFIGVFYLLIGANVMAYPVFHCAYEKDRNPPLDQEADSYFQQARAMEKAKGYKNWPLIVSLYEKAIEKDHWKAMNNLATLYYTGERATPVYGGIEKDTQKTLNLYARMVKLGVPVGYYNWAVGIERGYVKGATKTDASSYMFRAAELGSPLAQVRLGNFFAFGLPLKEQRDDIAEQYFRCAGAQDNPEALLSVADFFNIAKKNKPLAAYYYQKATSLGNMKACMFLEGIFHEPKNKMYDLGYKADMALSKMYGDMYDQLDKNPDLKFPNLLKDHPLPKHPTQGYDADHPDIKPK